MLENTHLYREIHEQPAALARLLSAGREAIECLVAAMRAREVCHVVIAARGTSDNAASSWLIPCTGCVRIIRKNLRSRPTTRQHLTSAWTLSTLVIMGVPLGWFTAGYGNFTRGSPLQQFRPKSIQHPKCDNILV